MQACTCDAKQSQNSRGVKSAEDRAAVRHDMHRSTPFLELLRETCGASREGIHRDKGKRRSKQNYTKTLPTPPIEIPVFGRSS